MKKGFILFQTLLLFVNLTMILSFSHQILSNKLIQMQRMREMNNRYYIESEIIKQIREEFMYYDTKDFTKIIRLCLVHVTYDEENFEAHISVRGLYTFFAVLEYNDDYATVKNYYYE